MSVPARKTAETTLRTSARLWGPLLIGVIAVVFSFPAGMALAIINWQRMGLVKKAKRHLYAAVIGMYVFVLCLVLLPPSISQIVFFAVDLIAFFYLRREIDQDTDAYAYAGNEVYPANGFLGVLIGVGIFLVVIIIFIATYLLLESVGLFPTV